MTVSPTTSRPVGRRSLLAYRIMAFTTGTVLLLGTVLLIVQYAGAHSIKHGVGLLWLAHGYLYLLYVIATVNLGIQARWHLVRIGIIALAGTIPTASFFAEHVVTRSVAVSPARSR